jgi:hypothetical protein
MKAHSVVINLLWFTALAQAGQQLPAATRESQSGQRKPTAPISINSDVTRAWIPPLSNKSPIMNPFPTQSCPHPCQIDLIGCPYEKLPPRMGIRHYSNLMNFFNGEGEVFYAIRD